MKDVLDINFSESNAYYIYPSKEIKRHGDKLLKLTGLRKKLDYYNKHVCSLAYSFNNEGLHCYGEYDHFKGIGEIFFRKNQDKNNDPDFDIYLEIRQKEIIRLKKLLNTKHNYTDKLTSFIEEKKGQFRFDVLRIHSNEYETFLANGGGTVPKNLLGTNDEINLEPSSSEERNLYNQFLYDFVKKLIENSQQLHRLVENDYGGFLYTTAIKEFMLQLDKALNRDITISNELKRIEAKFSIGKILNYPEMLYPYSISNLLEWQSALLNAFVNGKKFDFSRQKLSLHEVKALFHIDQVFEYYKQIKILKEHPLNFYQSQIGNMPKLATSDNMLDKNSTPIFVSYNRKESGFAVRLSIDLIEKGFNIWIDEMKILPGKMWDKEVENALISASSVLVILSKASVSSENVLDEISYALQHNKSIIPILIESCTVPMRLNRLQRVDFTKDYVTALNKLNEVLNSC